MLPFLDNMEKYRTDRQASDYNIIRCMRFACRLNINKHSEYEILITFTWQQWFRERASILRFAYTARLSKLC
jgi:hypothetical protein